MKRLIFVTELLLLNLLVFAQEAPEVRDISIEGLIGAVAKILYPAGIFIGVAMVVKSGYDFMVSQGSPNSTKAASENLTSALLGLLFILLSVVILRVIINSLFGGVGF
ncbi:hypothetical protein A3K34_04450 [candidate division WWE3 bacterium RIFOXYC1_FULL_40_10]|uniref:Uncharacterized protein n=1 Tax=candidate division WWE3 bacterium RIFOXYA2_FULL_46_9 TaxID=1802636 RepID=A0A1F4W1F4_UNCKA|nr:MAG: hypothetical protein A3K58_04450 [candidate division WWE3 bacterium RIFOXYB1_FULL_40_22]OGC62093.1 MAG: hypothetical protein A3K37_04450 [candidate division WWE3 bacterium RIFOXYA1_FULL_40_11]OGC63108.1 MAG: hypothetical protein A2264_00195 [candidate division WWE3 bacterium RIFOXYA2_FULL_46_9]OGC64964.1 MAG: hypothetical protein A2326_02915 [candidate division WWE3 bacterium RIFOXYB2_FULL_41_6]OGC66476.1 MAG: hypothetical protein A3K34_04450 [candidate division WWE3 bacterium RIFOXYC1_